jgi:hypothetical protein
MLRAEPHSANPTAERIPLGFNSRAQVAGWVRSSNQYSTQRDRPGAIRQSQEAPGVAWRVHKALLLARHWGH